MPTERERQFNNVLQNLAEALDIPANKYTQAVERYTAVGNWLDAEDSPLHQYKPSIYPQGSFRLGTVVRPLKDGEESDYDIDLVSELQIEKKYLTPRQLKEMVGSRLQDNADYKRMLDEEGSRCWTLEYAEEDGIGFHMDILPAIPDSIIASGISGVGVPKQYAKYAIAITDKDKTSGVYSWDSSNPKGYAEWFDNQKRLRSVERVLLASVDSVPPDEAKTPLQQAIQIFKRHRDMRFLGHKWEEQKPISMILTTLAALAYEKETDVYSTLINIIDRIDDYAHTNLIQKRNGAWYIPNPVDPAENFADRWNEPGSKRADAFFLWIRWVKEDVAAALKHDKLTDIERVLTPRFGKRTVQEALSKFGKARQSSVAAKSITLATAALPSKFDVPHRKRPRWPVRRAYQVSIEGRYKYNRKWKGFGNDSFSLPKGSDLFFAADTDTPAPFDVYWQVVNTGEEARRKEDLRGKIFPSKTAGRGGLSQEERTAYAGMHWIECFIVKNNVCVARSGEFVVNIK